MKFRITHSTRYVYAEPVSLSHNLVCLRPRDRGTQSCLRHELSVFPTPSARNDGRDYFGNHMTFFSLQKAHTELTIATESEVTITTSPQPDISRGSSWEQVRQTLLQPPNVQTLTAREFSFDSPYISRAADLAEYAIASFPSGRPMLECVLDLTERIHHDFEFLPGATKVGTPVPEVLRTRQGVCQDFAHLQIGCLRSLGLAARYISGYIATTPPPGQPRLTGADVSHAWISVFAPEFGWVDFDPTNGLMPSDGHITVAWARDYDDVGPIKGILVGGRRQRMDVAVDVAPIEAS